LGSDFDVRDWQHSARFNVQESRIEMHLQAKKNLTVQWQGQQRHFKQDETIHTEILTNGRSKNLPICCFNQVLQTHGIGPIKNRTTLCFGPVKFSPSNPLKFKARKF
jgi:uncharacterized SAM-dependent methyltransferase